jgi:hypothetical protein
MLNPTLTTEPVDLSVWVLLSERTGHGESREDRKSVV